MAGSYLDSTIERWHICFAGFLQDEGSADAGMVKLWRDLRVHASERCCVELRSWDDDVDALAELIWRMRSTPPPVVRLYGFSWGGSTALRLCEQLQCRGLYVASVVLSDAVYRSHWRLGVWRSVVGSPTLWVPRNVDYVWHARQKTDKRIRGHEVIARSGDPDVTKIDGPEWAVLHHRYMDDFGLFQDRALKVAA